MGTLDDVFGGMLVENGLERLGERSLYRGSMDSEIEPGRRQNVFVSFEDDSNPEIMSPIGLAEKLGDHDLASSRAENDGCDVTVVASFAALTRQLNINRLVEDPGSLISDAIALASYADLVGDRLTSRQNRKEELLSAIQGWLSDTTAVSSGQVSVEAFLETIESALDLIPQPGLLDKIQGSAMRTGIFEWAQDESGMNLSATPWNRVTDGLQSIRMRRGWPELAESDE